MVLAIVDQSGFKIGNPGQTSTLSYDHPGGTNSALVVLLAMRNGTSLTARTTSVTWNGVALTQIVGPANFSPVADDIICYAGILRNAVAGTHNIVIQVGPDAFRGMAIKAFSLTGVVQGGQAWGNFDDTKSTSSGASVTTTITTSTADSLILTISGLANQAGSAFSAWNAGWIESGSGQFVDTPTQAYIGAWGAAGRRFSTSAGATITATATYILPGDRRGALTVEILAEPDLPGGGSPDDKGALKHWPDHRRGCGAASPCAPRCRG